MSWTTANIPDQRGRTAVVTGANGGLGLVTARALAAKGAHVVMAVRNQQKAAAAVEEIRAAAPDCSLELVALDLSSQASVKEAAGQIVAARDSLDLLINNAGASAIAITPALLRTPGSRIVTVTSTAHLMGHPVDVANPHLEGRYGPWRAYGQAKLANFHFGLGLQRELERAGARTASLIAHPGLSNTDLQAVSVEGSGGGASQRFFHVMAQFTGMSANDGALPQLRAATDPAARGGEFYGPVFVNNGPPVRKPILHRLGMDRAIASRWEVPERETGVSLDVHSPAGA